MKILLLLLPFLFLACASDNTTSKAHLDIRVDANKPYHTPYFYPYYYSPYSRGGHYGAHFRYGGPRHSRNLNYYERRLKNPHKYSHKNHRNSYKRLDKRQKHSYNRGYSKGRNYNGFKR
jgi:hypothetical protein